MVTLLTLSIPGVGKWVNEIINTTNYRDMMTPAEFLKAGVARLYGDEHAALDVLFESLYQTHPELREWPYEDEDDLLLANHLTACAGLLQRIMVPMLSPNAVARYYDHTHDTLTVSVD